MSKTSFVLHDDSLIILDKMTNEQAGVFIKSLYYYRKNLELPELDFGMEMAITPFINQLIRDKEKWSNIAERNKHNGFKGGRPKLNNNNPNNPDGLSITQDNPEEPKKAVSVSVNVNDSVNVSVKENKNEYMIDLSFFKQEEQEIINDWIQYKKERKESYKPIGLKSLITTIKNNKVNGCNIIEAITVSMSNGWKGIIYEKGYSNNQLNNSQDSYMPDDTYPYPDLLFVNCNEMLNGALCGYKDGNDRGDYKKFVPFCLLTKEESLLECKKHNIDYNALKQLDYGIWAEVYNEDAEMAHKCIKGGLNVI